MLILEQSKNEEILHDNLKAHNHDVLWNHTLLNYQSNDNDYSIFFKKNADELEIIEAEYIVSCEGADSFFRKQLSVGFEGGTYESFNFVADVTLEWDKSYDKVLICMAQNTFASFFPMVGDKKYRIAGIVPDDIQKKQGTIIFDDLKEKIIDKIGINAKITGCNWFSLYRAHHRVASTFQKGNIFLTGDAGHVHSPAGGQGMNTGIQDAYNLAWKLAYVIKGYAAPELLQTYSEERVQNAHNLINKTDRLYAAEVGGGLSGWLRSHILPLIGKPLLKTDFARNGMFDIVSQTGITYEEASIAERDIHFSKVNAGDRLPYFEYMENGEKTTTYNTLQSPHFRLIVCSDEVDMRSFEEENEAHPEQIQFLKINYEENKNVLKNVFGYDGEFALIRPDNHIAIITDNITVEWRFFQLFHSCGQAMAWCTVVREQNIVVAILVNIRNENSARSIVFIVRAPY